MTDSDQATLSSFGDGQGDVHGDDAEDTDALRSEVESNRRDINALIDLLETTTENVGDVTESINNLAEQAGSVSQRRSENETPWLQ